MEEFTRKIYFGNTIYDYFVALLILIVCILIISVLKKVSNKLLDNWSEKTGTAIDSILVKLLHRFIIPFLYYGAFYYSIKSLNLVPKAAYVIDVASAIIVTFIMVRLIISVINYLLTSYFRRQAKGIEKPKQIRGITTIISIFIWGLGSVFLLDNLGFRISAIVTSLGIGGIAVALAAQAVLKDFFSYFVIFFDRPFEVGDFITVGDKSGTIEQIGIKTTKLRAQSGEQIIFANTDLTDSRIHNFARMQSKRMVMLKIRVAYQTTKEQIEEIPALVKKIILEQHNVTFDHGYFSGFGETSLNFEFAYFVNNADYIKYIETQHAVNLKVLHEFNKRGIVFAIPAPVVIVKNDKE